MNLIEDMQRTFGIPPRYWADSMFFACGLLVINPFIFEEFLKRRHGYRADGETFESINEFVTRVFGADAVALLDRAIAGERRGAS
jgi:hypothetical protein